MNVMLTADDIKKIAGNVRIVRFDELNRIESILPKSRDCCIIFYSTESRNVGHWVALTRSRDEYTFFDSYGNTEEEDYGYIPRSLKDDIEGDTLKAMLKGHKVVQNRIDFQSWKEGISTCGRWCASFIYFFKKGYDLSGFQRVMKKALNESDFKSYDELVTYLTS
jgi:hypothetical protein